MPVGKPHAVFTSATFAFDGSQPLGEDAIRAHCQIEDLHAFAQRILDMAGTPDAAKNAQALADAAFALAATPAGRTTSLPAQLPAAG